MNLKKILFAAPFLAIASTAFAAEPVAFERQDACVTDDTGGDGARHSCDFTTCFTASPGNFIDESTLTTVELDGRGSEHSCSAPIITRRETIEITLPNGKKLPMEFPTEVCVTGHARSPKGHFAGTGRVSCAIRGSVSPYN